MTGSTFLLKRALKETHASNVAFCINAILVRPQCTGSIDLHRAYKLAKLVNCINAVLLKQFRIFAYFMFLFEIKLARIFYYLWNDILFGKHDSEIYPIYGSCLLNASARSCDQTRTKSLPLCFYKNCLLGLFHDALLNTLSIMLRPPVHASNAFVLSIFITKWLGITWVTKSCLKSLRLVENNIYTRLEKKIQNK